MRIFFLAGNTSEQKIDVEVYLPCPCDEEHEQYDAEECVVLPFCLEAKGDNCQVYSYREENQG